MNSQNNVLIIDDDETFASTLLDFCEVSGLNAVNYSAREALDLFDKGQRFCCIILDLHMPEMDGISFLQALSRKHNLEKPPLILVSGFLQKEIRASAKYAKSLGFTSVQEVHKPFKLNELITDIRKIAGIAMPYDISQIEKGFQNGEFKQVYQPLIDLQNGQCFAVEALTRWYPKTGSTIAPNLFIPLIETSSLLESFTFWTIEQASKQWKIWADHGVHLNIAVNLSANSLDIPKMSDVCNMIAHKYEMPMSELIVEVTETATFDHPQNACECLNQFRNHKAQLAVDDFGTGYSSLKQLMQLPYSEVKIDQCFTSEILNDKAAEAIVKAVVGLSHSLGYKVIAEGVETPEIDQQLKKLGVDFAQGYFYSKPITGHEILDFITEFNHFKVRKCSEFTPLKSGMQL